MNIRIHKDTEQKSLTDLQSVDIVLPPKPRHSTDEILAAVNRYYHACRYLGVIITVKSLSQALSINDALSSSFCSFESWNTPGESPAPPNDCYVSNFFKQVFITERAGLIINEPENWLYQWTANNQKAFWCALSQHYGRSPIIAITKEVYSTTTMLQYYFSVSPIALNAARFWVSNHHIS